MSMLFCNKKPEDCKSGSFRGMFQYAVMLRRLISGLIAPPFALPGFDALSGRGIEDFERCPALEGLGSVRRTALEGMDFMLRCLRPAGCFVFCKQYDKKEGKHIGQRKPEYLKLICPCSCDHMQEAADNITKKCWKIPVQRVPVERDAQAPCKARDTGGEEIAGAEKQRRGNCQAALPATHTTTVIRCQMLKSSAWSRLAYFTERARRPSL